MAKEEIKRVFRKAKERVWGMVSLISGIRKRGKISEIWKVVEGMGEGKFN